MDHNELLAQARAKLAAVEAIVNDPAATDDAQASVAELLADAKRLQAKAGQLRDIAAMAGALREDPPKSAAPEQKWGALTDFLEAVWRAKHVDPTVRQTDNRLRLHKDEPDPTVSRKQMVENVGASGGFLVPTEFLAELQAVQGEDSLVRPRATIIRMNRRAVDIPVLDQTATTAGVPHWFGGMLGYWSEEAEEKTLTLAKFRKITLVAHKLIGYTRASDELVTDSAVSLSDLLTGRMGFAGLISWMEDYAFLRGTGAGQPLGVLNAGATISYARAAAGAISYADLVGMLESFLPTGRGVWQFTQGAMSNLLTLQDPAGNYIWQPNAREGVPQTLFGFPVYFTEKLPAVGTAGDVLLADWSYYLVGDRQATTVESTNYDRWAYDQTSWRAVHRVDGQPWLSTPLTLADGTAQVSPFVILGAKST